MSDRRQSDEYLVLTDIDCSVMSKDHQQLHEQQSTEKMHQIDNQSGQSDGSNSSEQNLADTHVTDVSEPSSYCKISDADDLKTTSTSHIVKIVRDNALKIVKPIGDEENWDDKDDVWQTENSAVNQQAGNTVAFADTRQTWQSDEEVVHQDTKPNANPFGCGKYKRYSGKFNRQPNHKNNDCHTANDYCREDGQQFPPKSRPYNFNKKNRLPGTRDHQSNRNNQWPYNAAEDYQYSDENVNKQEGRQSDYDRQNTRFVQPTMDDEQSWQPIEQCVRANSNRCVSDEENWDDDADTVPLEKIGDNLGNLKKETLLVANFVEHNRFSLQAMYVHNSRLKQRPNCMVLQK